MIAGTPGIFQATRILTASPAVVESYLLNLLNKYTRVPMKFPKDRILVISLHARTKNPYGSSSCLLWNRICLTKISKSCMCIVHSVRMDFLHDTYTIKPKGRNPRQREITLINRFFSLPQTIIASGLESLGIFLFETFTGINCIYIHI